MSLKQPCKKKINGMTEKKNSKNNADLNVKNNAQQKIQFLSIQFIYVKQIRKHVTRNTFFIVSRNEWGKNARDARYANSRKKQFKSTTIYWLC